MEEGNFFVKDFPLDEEEKNFSINIRGGIRRSKYVAPKRK